jgi:hypothetical protein
MRNIFPAMDSKLTVSKIISVFLSLLVFSHLGIGQTNVQILNSCMDLKYDDQSPQLTIKVFIDQVTLLEGNQSNWKSCKLFFIGRMWKTYSGINHTDILDIAGFVQNGTFEFGKRSVYEMAKNKKSTMPDFQRLGAMWFHGTIHEGDNGVSGSFFYNNNIYPENARMQNVFALRNERALCGLTWTIKQLPSTLDEGWIRVSLDDIKIIDSEKGLAQVTLTMENTKAIFFEVDAAKIHSREQGDVVLQGEQGFILYPFEKIPFPHPILLTIPCDAAESHPSQEIDLDFSRGEFVGLTLDQLLERLGLFVGSPLPLNPFAFYNVKIGFSNKAVYMSTLNILWTAATGQWMNRDFMENGLSAFGSVVENCRECQEALEPIGGSLSGDIVGILYARKVEPQFFIKILFEVMIKALKNPLFRDAAFNAVKDYLPATLTKGGPMVLAQNLSVIISGGGRVLALAPIAWDVWSTTVERDYKATTVEAKCCDGW